MSLVADQDPAQVRYVLPISVLEIPLDLPANQLGMAWHRRADHDPVHRWLRDNLTALEHTTTY